MLKIIVAEDSEAQRMYLCSIIDALGYEAIPAEDGLEALELVNKTNAQIVISDLQMPKIDGIELTRKIRSMDGDHYIHIIMITGSDEGAVRKEAVDAGVDDFLNKGSSTSMLEARLRTATRLVKHADELARRARILKEYNDRIQADLHAAANAQQQLLPRIHEEFFGFSIASAFVPSAIVSGDMFGCFPISDDKLGFYAVDVSGHGVHASLLSVAIGHLITPAYFRTKTIDKSGAIDPAALVASLNARFCRSENDDYFTMFCGVIDRSSGRMEYCQAGYPPPYYVTETGAVEPVGDGGFPVGMFSEAEYDNNVLNFEMGAALIICSDAAAEAEDRSGIPFGETQLRDIVANTHSIGAEQMPDHLVNALNQWRAGEPLDDDLTVVALGRKVTHDTYHTA